MSNPEQKFKEEGIVRRFLASGLAIVEIKRTSACGKCGICARVDEKTMSVEAVNKVSATVGQNVVVEVSESNVLKAGAIVYIMPIAFMFLGLLVGFAIGGESAATLQIILAFGFFLGSFPLVSLMGKKYNDIKYKPEITEILD